MPEFPPDSHADLVFIGAGPKTTGVLLALAATQDAGAGLTIHLIDPYPPGAGRIWRTAQSPHLWMNSRAEDITIFPDLSSTLERTPVFGPSLHEWAHGRGRERLAAAGLGREAAALDAQSFASRRIQGHYLEWAFELAIERLAARVHVHRSRAEAVDRLPDDSGFRVVTSEGVSILAVTVISAQGHLDMAPAEADLHLEESAGSGLYYQGPGFTADLDFGAIPAGADVLTRGFGLAFIDLMVMVTQGRGGEFVEHDGRLRYRRSGREPVLWVGSSRGVPYSPKLGYSRADLPGAPLVDLRYLTGERLGDHFGEPLGEEQGRTIDFRSVIGPLAELELTYAHYRHVLWKRAIGDTGLLALIDAVAEDILAAGTEPGDGGADSGDRLLYEGRRRIAADAHSLLKDPADLFDLAAIDRPIADAEFGNLGEGEARVRTYIEAQLARSADAGHSADLAVFEALVKSYVAIRLLVRDGRVSPRDRTAYVEGSFHSLFSFIGNGPPPERIRQIIALHDEGLLRFLGPGLQVEVADTEFGATSSARATSSFRATSSARPDASTFSYFVEARLAKQSAVRALDPALGALRGSGGTLLEGGDGAVAEQAKLRTDAHSRALDEASRVQRNLFLLGPGVSGATAEAFSRPHTDAPVFKDNERIASVVLASLDTGASVGSWLWSDRRVATGADRVDAAS